MDAFALRLILSFVLGGLTVALFTTLAERRGSRLGGLLLSFPVKVVIALVLIALNEGIGFAAQAARGRLPQRMDHHHGHPHAEARPRVHGRHDARHDRGLGGAGRVRARRRLRLSRPGHRALGTMAALLATAVVSFGAAALLARLDGAPGQVA